MLHILDLLTPNEAAQVISRILKGAIYIDLHETTASAVSVLYVVTLSYTYTHEGSQLIRSSLRKR